jgi:hypothetical protein
MTKNIFDLISREDALRVLRNLCDVDEAMRERVLLEVNKVLNQIDPDAVAEDVLFDFDLLSVDDLWNRSGPRRDGYSSPDEMAVEMVEETLRPYVKRISEYHEAGMPEEAKQYCMGVLKGIYRYDQASESEFKKQAPDVPSESFGWILMEWQNQCARKDSIEEMKEFLSRECPKWAD